MVTAIGRICAVASVLGAALGPSGGVADCECGYSVNATSFPFTDLLETDFLHLQNITLDSDWVPQNYTVNSLAARGAYGKNASLDNVVANPLNSTYEWTGRGVSGGNPGLQLYVRGGVPKDGLIPMGEVATARVDMLYGSFRAAIKLSDTPGTCAAFFWVCTPCCGASIPTTLTSSQYFNDTEEIDLEFLSSQLNASSSPVNLVLQSPASQQAGFDAAGTPTFDLYQLPFHPDTGYHEYRFDWSPERVSFYADGAWLKDMTTSVPTSPGHITFSHWSNGNSEWSRGPPAVDAVMTVSYLKAYFNSSAPSRQQDYYRRCTNPTATNATCVIPLQSVAPDPLSSDGNTTAHTFFFSQQHNMTANQTIYIEPKKSQASPMVMITMTNGIAVML
ncbi:MAG: hypothetical protein M1830_004440, partial [Pleopsidium flavum]